jgi:predicted O-methyltransferase YrrM
MVFIPVKSKFRFEILKRLMICLAFIQGMYLYAHELTDLPPPYCDLKELYPYDDFGWFAPDKEKVIGNLIRDNNVKVVVELGSLLGKSTRFIAKCLPDGGKIYAVDHWLGNIEHHEPNVPKRQPIYSKMDTLYERFLSNIIHEKLWDKVIPVRATTLEAVFLINEQPDLVFVDASHEYDEVFRDLEAWYPRIKKGGILCGDDWIWGETKPVQRAVKHFANKHNLQCFPCGRVWWMRVEENK